MDRVKMMNNGKIYPSGIYHANSNEGKIIRWTQRQEKGTRFTASSLGKEINLTGATIGLFIRWHEENFKKAGKAKNGSTQIWEIVDPVISCQ
jgi:hypothetical protein